MSILQQVSAWSKIIRTYIHPFNGPFPGLPRRAGTRKVKPIWILLKQESVWQWHQLGHMQVCTSLQTAPHHSVFTERMPFLPPNQQRQSTEGTKIIRMQWYSQTCNCFPISTIRDRRSHPDNVLWKLGTTIQTTAVLALHSTKQRPTYSNYITDRKQDPNAGNSHVAILIAVSVGANSDFGHLRWLDQRDNDCVVYDFLLVFYSNSYLQFIL